jgi:hypothetical protein
VLFLQKTAQQEDKIASSRYANPHKSAKRAMTVSDNTKKKYGASKVGRKPPVDMERQRSPKGPYSSTELQAIVGGITTGIRDPTPKKAWCTFN